MNGYIALYNGKKIELYAETLYDAKLKAIQLFKVNKKNEWQISVYLCEKDNKPVIHYCWYHSMIILKPRNYFLGFYFILDDYQYMPYTFNMEYISIPSMIYWRMYESSDHRTNNYRCSAIDCTNNGYFWYLISSLYYHSTA